MTVQPLWAWPQVQGADWGALVLVLGILGVVLATWCTAVAGKPYLDGNKASRPRCSKEQHRCAGPDAVSLVYTSVLCFCYRGHVRCARTLACYRNSTIATGVRCSQTEPRAGSQQQFKRQFKTADRRLSRSKRHGSHISTHTCLSSNGRSGCDELLSTLVGKRGRHGGA